MTGTDSEKKEIEMESELEKELAATLNRHCAENASNTPDFILAQFILGCLASFDAATQQRETWYGRDERPPFGGPVGEADQ